MMLKLNIDIKLAIKRQENSISIEHYNMRMYTRNVDTKIARDYGQIAILAVNRNYVHS